MDLNRSGRRFVRSLESVSLIYFYCGVAKKQLIPTMKLIREKSRNLYVFFSCRLGATHRKIDDLSICPPSIILDLFHLLIIPIPG